jgi:hypothetical protein
MLFKLFAPKCLAVPIFLGLLILSSSASAQAPFPVSPKGLRGFYVQASAQNRSNVLNATGTFVFLLWNGASAESDTVCTFVHKTTPIDTTVLVCVPVWQGYRVRRTIEGISPGRLEVVGQWKGSDLVGPLCLDAQAPCNRQQFRFTGTGIFFKGFQNNRRPDGSYILDYPPGAPADQDTSARVYVDSGGLVGFSSEYAVTSIDTVRVVNADFYESPVDSSEIVHLTPSTSPENNMEHVGVVPNPYKESAEWDPAPNQRRIHFIHLPAGAIVRIFTASGELLRTLTQNPNANPGGLNGDLEWDLKNARGNPVVSGIYIYTVHPPDGRTPKKGHFVIIK